MLQELFLKLIGAGINFIALFNADKAGRMALRIYRRPREGRLEAQDRKFLNTAEVTAKIGAQGAKVMSYLWNSAGKKEVLLLHGWESNAARWKPLISKLVKHNFRVVAIDAPAHGDSDRRSFDMVQYVNAIGEAVRRSTPNFVIGHSLGGSSLSFYLSRNVRQRFEKIVLMSVPSDLYDLTVDFANMMGFNQRTLKALSDAFRSTFELELKSISVREFCKSIEIKTLVLHDHKDDVAAVEDAINYHEILENSELHLTQGYDHSMQALEVYNRIISFIKK